ncbi:MAG: hypothetical protein ACRCVV_14835 [Shewanella sp.]|uniref:hypothetical protein n=1 Tax=Aeromonas popoffii TaxID=70856 RepID=UPI003F3584B9
MASFKDYQATKTATVEIFHGEHLTVRQLSSAEFLAAALPLHRERIELEQAGKFDEAAETRINLSTAFALVDSWSFDDDLTLDNFIELLQCDDLKGVAAQVVQNIDRTASDPDNFVKKKSPSSSTGLSESGSLTAAQEKKTSKRAAKA